MSFPDTRETKLGGALVKYCSELVNSDRLDEAAAESVNIAMECLQQAFGFEDIPNSDIDLLDVVCGKEEKSAPAEEHKSTEYCDFMWEIEQKGYYKGCEVGDEEYLKRLEVARGKYNSRFPENPVEPCELTWEERKKAAVAAKTAGNTALKGKEFKTALTKYTEAIQLDPTDAAFYSNRSACYLHLNDGEKGQQDANRAVQRKPDWAKGYMRLGAAKRQLKDFDGAIKAYRVALTKVTSEDPLWQTIQDHISQCENAKKANIDG